MSKKSARNSFCLFMAAAIWGMAFVSQSKGMEYMGPFTFNGVRSLIGSVAIALYLFLTRMGKKGKIENKYGWTDIKAGVFCGLALTAASTLQQFGIRYTTVGKAGFITTLYIIFVTVAGIFFKKKVSAVVWMAAAMAAVGMYLLCMTESLRLSVGDALVFACAILFTAHIMIIDHYAPKTDGVLVSCIQFLFCGVVCTGSAFIWEAPKLSQLAGGMGTLLYAGVMSCGIAYTLQIVGQKGVNPTIAALILSLESVVATVTGFLAYKIGFLKTDQSMTIRQIIGCVIVFVAIILVQLPGEWFARKKKTGRNT